MKIKNLILILLLITVVPLRAQFELQPGTILTYEVTNGATTYDFVVTVVQLEPELKLKYEMGAPANINGTVSMTDEALQNATRQVTWFGGGEMVLNDATTIFMSRKNYEEAFVGGNYFETSISFDDDPTVYDFQETIEGTYEARVNGELMKFDSRHATAYTFNPETEEVDYGPAIFTVADPEYPLIVWLYKGFTVKLIEVENAITYD